MTQQGDIDWDDAFANMAHVPGSEKLPEVWAGEAAGFRKAHTNKQLDIAYGEHARERYDLFLPEGDPKGTVVFVHGGYWLKFDKSAWSHLAAGALARGFAVAMPSYTLAPQARLSHMTGQIGQAINVIAAQGEGPLRLTGHSAGGHLVSRMLCDDSPLEPSVLQRVEHVMSISGLHDLAPLMHTKMNEGLRLDDEEAALESAVKHKRVGDAAYTAYVGGGERPEFIRQSQLIAEEWPNTRLIIDGDHNHFTVIEGLAQSDSKVTNSLLG